MNNPLDVEVNEEYALDLALHFRLGGLLLCLGVITVNPGLVISDDTGQRLQRRRRSDEAPRRR
jgi:hypothetical protein